MSHTVSNNCRGCFADFKRMVPKMMLVLMDGVLDGVLDGVVVVVAGLLNGTKVDVGCCNVPW